MNNSSTSQWSIDSGVIFESYSSILKFLISKQTMKKKYIHGRGSGTCVIIQTTKTCKRFIMYFWTIEPSE